MSNSFQVSSFIRRPRVSDVAIVFLLGGSMSGASAQTAPQLLPYNTKLLAGGGATATFTVGQTCPQAGAPNVALDKYGDGCLATEVQLSSTDGGPRHAIVDSYGNVFFGDYTAGLVRRVDAFTGLITAVAGNVALSTTPSTNAACTSGSSTTSADILGDGCLGTQVKLGRPSGLAFDTAGNLYFTDPYNYNIRKIAATTGYVGYTTINGAGAGYTVAPTVTFSAAPSGGITATGTAEISVTGVVLGIFVTNAGSGYTTPPTITFSGPTTSGGTTATAAATLFSGIPPTGGTISLIDGDGGGTSSKYGYESNNGSLTSCTETGAICINPATQGYVDGPEGMAFDPNGNLYFADYYDTSVLVINTTGTQHTVTGVGIPGGTVSKILGAPGTANTLAAGGASGYTVCTNGASCGYSSVFLAGTANATETDYPFGVSFDSTGNVYYASEYYYNIAFISSGGVLSNFAGTPGTKAVASGTSLIPVTRGPAGSFPIGSSFDVTADNYANANVYFPDSTNGYIWRVDGTGKTMYLIGGGGSGICATATDTFGDGCPGLNATFSSNGGNGTSSATTASGVYGTFVDSYADLFIADQKNNLVRELASGTQFGVIGANQPVQTIEIHFSAGDVPSTATYTLTSNPTNFALGKATCSAANTDGTTDCTMPITATPTAYGYFSSNLQITSSDGTNSFLLSGIFEPSPQTRTSISAGTTACSGISTYSTALPTVLTANLTFNGPSTPNGVFNFYVNGSTTPLNTKPIAVGNLSTTGAAVYGATFNYTFATAGTYSIDAVYSGDTYYLTSTSSTATIVAQAPGASLAVNSQKESIVSPGQTALYSFNISGIYAGTATFAVTGLPANSSYSLSPSLGVTGSGCLTGSTIALSVMTQQQTTVLASSFGGTGHGLWQLPTAMAGVILALIVGLRRRTTARFRQLYMVIALLLVSSGLSGCGKAAGSVLQPATPAGTYSIVVSATIPGQASPAPITFSLIVQ